MERETAVTALYSSIDILAALKLILQRGRREALVISPEDAERFCAEIDRSAANVRAGIAALEQHIARNPPRTAGHATTADT